MLLHFNRYPVILFTMMKTKTSVILIILISLIFPSGPGCSRKEETGEKKKPGSMRIVSLSPAITREIIDLDSENLLVGVTSYHPVMSRKVEIAGTLKTPNFEKILTLKPDIIFLSEEDSRVQSTERLESIGIKIHLFKRNSGFEAICGNYLILAEMIGKRDLGKMKVKRYRRILAGIKSTGSRERMVILVSHVPLMAATGTSYVDKIINDAGGENIFADLENPFSIISAEALIRRNPEVIISMMPDAVEYLKKLLSKFKNLKAVKNNRIYEITPEHIAHFTPADYIKSVELISAILRDKKQSVTD